MTVIPTTNDERSNTLVAESDLLAAKKALQKRMDQTIAKYANDPAQRVFLQACADSLQQNLDRIVQPISDEAFHVYLKRYDDKEDDEQDIVHDENAENNNTAATNHDDINDFDEEDLLDPQALKRVKELREQVRKKAADVQALRTTVLDKAISFGERQVHSWGPTTTTTPDVNNDETVIRSHEEKMVKQLDELNSALTETFSSLEQHNNTLPDQVERLQETIAVIRESLRKQENQDLLSQTEQAIVGKRDIIPMTAIEEQDPEERVANLLSS